HTRLQGDWSSDVCSSDLSQLGSACAANVELQAGGYSGELRAYYCLVRYQASDFLLSYQVVLPRCPGVLETQFSQASLAQLANRRSEERRVGKECRSRWWV